MVVPLGVMQNNTCRFVPCKTGFIQNFLLLKYKFKPFKSKHFKYTMIVDIYECLSDSVKKDLSPDLRTVPGVLLPPPVGWPPGPGEPAFLVSRLLKKLASTPSLV